MKQKPQGAVSRSRRRFLARGAAALAGAAAAPVVFARQDFTLRVLGTHVTLQEEIRQKAMQDLGIRIVFEPGGSAEVLHRAATRPATFDIYEQWSNSIKVLWQAGSIQPIDTRRIRYWDDVNALAREGRLDQNASFGAGDAPYRLLWVQNDGRLGERPTERISFLPYVHNTDSFGYNSSVIARGTAYQGESWAWLLDPRYAGKVAIVNAPTIGIFDLALAARAQGLVEFGDIGNLTRAELDALFRVLIDYKRAKHFRGVWSSVPQSVEFMQRDEVIIESMFSPGVAALNGMGIPCVYAAPREGYRAWHGVMCLSAMTGGATRDAAYAYMDWWLSGWAGAFIARQGYYISTPHLSRGYMSDDEWNYWYLGKPTRSDLTNTFGEVSIRRGESRNGGSYHQRFGNVAVWNTVMDTYEYSLLKWQEFLLA